MQIGRNISGEAQASNKVSELVAKMEKREAGGRKGFAAGREKSTSEWGGRLGPRIEDEGARMGPAGGGTNEILRARRVTCAFAASEILEI